MHVAVAADGRRARWFGAVAGPPGEALLVLTAARAPVIVPGIPAILVGSAVSTTLYARVRSARHSSVRPGQVGCPVPLRVRGSADVARPCVDVRLGSRALRLLRWLPGRRTADRRSAALVELHSRLVERCDGRPLWSVATAPMTETAILRWRSERTARIAELYGLYEDASVAAVATRPAAVEQLRLMLVVTLAAEWQASPRTSRRRRSRVPIGTGDAPRHRPVSSDAESHVEDVIAVDVGLVAAGQTNRHAAIWTAPHGQGRQHALTAKARVRGRVPDRRVRGRGDGGALRRWPDVVESAALRCLFPTPSARSARSARGHLSDRHANVREGKGRDTMARTGRNEPCPCGSGRKTKRCCGTVAGPSPAQRARAWLDAQAREWAPLLVEYTDSELDELLEDVWRLPRLDLSLRVPLPRLLPPSLERLRRLVADGEHDAIAGATDVALSDIDTPERRAHLARAVLTLHDEGHRLDCDVTAYAICDLAENDPPVLLSAALAHTVAVTAGAARTPAGLLVASR